MAFKGTIFLMCLAVLGLSACGPSIEANLQADLRPFEGGGDGGGGGGGDGGDGGYDDGAGDGALARQLRIDNFLAEDRMLDVMGSGTTFYATDAALGLFTDDTFELNVTWNTGATETLSYDFQRLYSNTTGSQWDLAFADGGILLRPRYINGELNHCAELHFERGPLRSVKFNLCER